MSTNMSNFVSIFTVILIRLGCLGMRPDNLS